MFPLLYSTTVDTLLYIASMHKHEKIGKKTSLVLKPKSEKKNKNKWHVTAKQRPDLLHLLIHCDWICILYKYSHVRLIPVYVCIFLVA